MSKTDAVIMKNMGDAGRLNGSGRDAGREFFLGQEATLLSPSFPAWANPPVD
jgi:hypothetical protein